MEQRTILFRGKRVDNGEWIYGYYARLEGDTLIYSPEAILVEEATDSYENHLVKYEVRPETIGQFTGQEDKNGKKIFEGDRMTCKFERGPDKTGIIKFWKTHGGYVLVDDFNRNIGRLQSMWSYDTTIQELPEGGIDGEIIGTIHDK